MNLIKRISNSIKLFLNIYQETDPVEDTPEKDKRFSVKRYNKAIEHELSIKKISKLPIEQVVRIIADRRLLEICVENIRKQAEKNKDGFILEELFNYDKRRKELYKYELNKWRK